MSAGVLLAGMGTRAADARRVEGGVYLETDSPERRDMEPIRRVSKSLEKKN